MSITNGHHSALVGNNAITNGDTPRSDSELSDLQDPVTGAFVGIATDQDESMDDAVHDMETSQSDGDDDAEGEEDADFDIETPPRENGTMRRLSTSSGSSGRPNKRKASVDDDELMLQNPELYGLRRSVGAVTSGTVVNG